MFNFMFLRNQGKSREKYQEKLRKPESFHLNAESSFTMQAKFLFKRPMF